MQTKTRLNVDLSPDQMRALRLARINDGIPTTVRIRELIDEWMLGRDNYRAQEDEAG